MTGLAAGLDGWVGQGCPVAALQLDHHLVVRGLADHLDDLLAQVLIRGNPTDERVVALGAPPVEVVAALAPVAALPLAQRRRDVPVVVGVMLEAQRQLPADVGLPVDVPLAGLDRSDVQSTTGAAGKVGLVVEDAGALDDPSLRGSVLDRKSVV